MVLYSDHPTYNVRLRACYYALAPDVLHARARSPTVLGYDVTFQALYSSAQRREANRHLFHIRARLACMDTDQIPD
jgi:hypothetical protein